MSFIPKRDDKALFNAINRIRSGEEPAVKETITEELQPIAEEPAQAESEVEDVGVSFTPTGLPIRDDSKLFDAIRNVREAYHLDNVNDIQHDDDSKGFAKEYRDAMKGDYRVGGPRGDDEAKSEAFWNKYDVAHTRHGFAGSGTKVFTHKETGEKFEVDTNANGKTFYGTTHSIKKVGHAVVGAKTGKKYVVANAQEIPEKDRDVNGPHANIPYGPRGASLK